MRRIATVLTAIAALIGAAQLGPMAQATAVGAVSVFAHVPAPGHPDTSIVAPDGTVIVSTNRGARGSVGPSKLLRYSTAGRLLRTYTLKGQNVASDHGAMGMALDKQGRLYVADYAPPRVLRIDLHTGSQTTFATVPDLSACVVSGVGCDNGVGDQKPWPDGLAFTRDGELLVTDLAQGTIFTVAASGGVAQIWLQDPRFRSTFGPNQLVFDKDGSLVVDVTASLGPTTLGRGVVYRIPIASDGRPGALHQVYATGVGEGPDGFAIGASGRIYLCTLVTDRVITIGVDGSEQASFQHVMGPAGFDSPSSATFLGSDLLVTNLTYFTDNPADDLVLRVHVNDRAIAAYPFR